MLFTLIQLGLECLSQSQAVHTYHVLVLRAANEGMVCAVTLPKINSPTPGSRMQFISRITYLTKLQHATTAQQIMTRSPIPIFRRFHPILGCFDWVIERETRKIMREEKYGTLQHCTSGCGWYLMATRVTYGLPVSFAECSRSADREEKRKPALNE